MTRRLLRKGSASIGLLLVAFAAVSACARKEPRAAASEGVPVTVGTAARQAVPLEVRAIGHVDSYSTVSLRSEEHTSELQSQSNLVCRLLLEKKKTIYS